ncbi:RagB/SusD family nutrient uptake outer membrane protein [Fulvivirga sp. M361]|uniref:RagB/SusD family nutrient uptake outer membrane protein n=1 Tax=Fulvivirga sp. M361 TaxID=2594266 RepID=UPI00117A7639|nr:RagB/SusD family nutrient uptake outer membrane protein [Fulvivirga sp. M361]TRX59528.1 RagB/SusD family nutrient uptake outer membrane protein [Fulvivirga sp. M361]
MKNIHIKLSFLLLLAAFSCDDYFEPDPISFVSGDSYYTNDDELENGILSIYDGLQGENSTSFSDLRATQIEFILTEMRTDNTQSKNGGNEDSDFQQFEVYAVNIENFVVRNYYESMYNIIFRTHLVLDNLDAASDDRRGAFEGEAKFARAYVYFQLVRLFGDVPMPLRVITPQEEEISFTRIEKSIIYDQIIEDLEIAVKNLDNTHRTRASKAAAQALLAKVHLTLAGAEDTDAGNNYTAARLLCEEIINSGEFSLEANYSDVFYNEVNDGTGNSEVIFAINYVEDNPETSQNYSREWTDKGFRFFNFTTENIRNKYFERGETVRALFTESSNDPGTFFVTKYLPNGSILEQSGNDWIVLRYADVLLMYAEAVMGVNQTTGDALALDAYNSVRNRAGFTTPVNSISKSDLLEERRMELAYENHRFFDLFRFGAEVEVLSEHALEIGASFTSTDLLLPIPQNERNLSRGVLTQNPGYSN